MTELRACWCIAMLVAITGCDRTPGMVSSLDGEDERAPHGLQLAALVNPCPDATADYENCRELHPDEIDWLKDVVDNYYLNADSRCAAAYGGIMDKLNSGEFYMYVDRDPSASGSTLIYHYGHDPEDPPQAPGEYDETWSALKAERTMDSDRGYSTLMHEGYHAAEPHGDHSDAFWVGSNCQDPNALPPPPPPCNPEYGFL